MAERKWGYQNIIKKIFGTKDSAYKGNKKTDYDICEEPASKAKYENSYKKIYPLGTGVCGCHYPPEAVFHEEIKGPYYQRVGQGSGGAMDWGCTHVNAQVKGGQNFTQGGPSQDVRCNAVRQCYGTSKGQHPEVNPGGGLFTDIGGNECKYTVSTETGGTSANKGMFTTGHMIMNAEKGVGIGVNRGTNQNVWTRWEPDGTFHLQVKPDGNNGAEAFVKIKPNGEVTIETRGTCNIKARNINIESNRMNVDVNHTNWKGNITQTGKHSADEQTGCKC